METQQIPELLAKLNAKMDANQAKAGANTKAKQEEKLVKLKPRQKPTKRKCWPECEKKINLAMQR
jgi:hypothetical protein